MTSHFALANVSEDERLPGGRILSSLWLLSDAPQHDAVEGLLSISHPSSLWLATWVEQENAVQARIRSFGTIGRLRDSILSRSTIETGDGGVLYADAALLAKRDSEAAAREISRPERSGSAAVVLGQGTARLVTNTAAIWGLLTAAWLETHYGHAPDGRQTLVDQLLREVAAADLGILLQASVVETGEVGVAVFASPDRLQGLAKALPSNVSRLESVEPAWRNGLALSIAG